AEFYFQQAKPADAKNYFRDFRGAILVSLGGALDQLPDTLEAGWMLTHYAEGTVKTGLLFASSCLFRVNLVTLVVTVPAYSQYGYSLDALSYYRKLLTDRTMKHSIHLTQFHGDSFEIAQTPLEVRHVSATEMNS